MENRNIVIANTPFNPHFTQGESVTTTKTEENKV